MHKTFYAPGWGAARAGAPGARDCKWLMMVNGKWLIEKRYGTNGILGLADH
jgi:hypothetical protein